MEIKDAPPQIPNSPSTDNRKQKPNDKPQGNEKSKLKPQYTIFKYCCHGKEYLKEAILLSGRPTFLRYENSQFKTSDEIDESSRILKPPNWEEYPYEPYQFSALKKFIYTKREAKRIESPDILYEKALSIVNKCNNQDQHSTVLLAGDIVWSYFQDKFSTTHYVEIVGDNGQRQKHRG